jgi:hypothetical protein
MRAFYGNTTMNRVRAAAWNCNNMSASFASAGRKRKSESVDAGASLAAAEAKWAWIDARLQEATSPDVLVLCEVIASSVVAARPLRKRLSKLGFETRVCVEGVGGDGTCAMIVAVKRAFGTIVQFACLEERVAGLRVKTADKTIFNFAAIHGVHGSVVREQASVQGADVTFGSRNVNFSTQLVALGKFLEQHGGGLALGDFNRVPCKRWRVGGNWSTDKLGDLGLRSFCSN